MTRDSSKLLPLRPVRQQVSTPQDRCPVPGTKGTLPRECLPKARGPPLPGRARKAALQMVEPRPPQRHNARSAGDFLPRLKRSQRLSRSVRCRSLFHFPSFHSFLLLLFFFFKWIYTRQRGVCSARRLSVKSVGWLRLSKGAL